MNDAQAVERLGQLEIETPSWGYGNSGPRSDPVDAFRRAGHARRLARERGTASVVSAYETT